MIFAATLHQMIVFFVMLVIGAVAARSGVAGRDAMGPLSRFVTSILLPAQLFYCTYTGATRQAIFDNLVMIALAAAFYAVVTVVTFLLGHALRLSGDRRRAFQLCFIFGNTGFVGMPLISAVFPESGLLYMSLFTLVDQLLFWTMGVYLSTAREAGGSDEPGHDPAPHQISWRTFISPNTISMLLVFAVILADLELPTLATDVLGSISNAAPAMCMIYLGIMLYYSDFLSAFKTPDLYAGIAVKMIVLPVVAGRLLLIVNAVPIELLECFVVIMALPTMTLVPIIARRNGHEGDYAAGTTVATLVASVATIPLVVWLTFG